MRRRTRIVYVLGAVAVLAGVAAYRWTDLKRKGAELVATSERFPRDYRLPKGKGALVVLGDSTALGVGASRYEENLAYLAASAVGAGRVVDLGVSGARALDARDQLARLPEGPIRFALVSITANDATHGTSPSDVEDDLKAILDVLEERGVQRAFLTTTPNFVGTPALPWPAGGIVARRAATLAATVRKVAARYPFVRVADLNRRGTLRADEYAADGFHPNAAGYRRWAEIVVEEAP